MSSSSIGRQVVLIVVAASAALAVLVIVLVLAISYQTQRHSTEGALLENHAAISNLLEREVNEVAASVNTVAGQIATDDASVDSVRQAVVATLGSGASTDVVNVHLYLTRQRDVITLDYHASGDPTALANAPIGILDDALPSSPDETYWFNIARSRDEATWYGPFFPDYGTFDALVVAYAVPVENGLLWAEVPVAVYEGIIAAQLQTQFAGNVEGYAFLMTQGGDIIAAVEPPGLLPEVGDRLPNIIELPGYPEAQNNSQSSNLGIPTRMADPLDNQGRQYVLNDIVPRTGWRLVRVIPDTVLQEAVPLRATAAIVGVVVLGLMAIGFGITRYMDQVVLTPLERLTSAAHTIGAGDLRYQIAHQERTDEVGHLAVALEEMKSNLSTSYEQLEDWSSKLEQRVKSRTRELEIARREAQASANELRAVYDESLLVVSAYQLQTILQTLMQRIHTLLDASYTAVWLVEEDQDHIRLVNNTSDDKASIGNTLKLGEGLAGRTALEHKLQVVEDYPNWSHREKVETADNLHQAMAVPLVFSNDIIGAVVVGRSYEDPFFEVDDQRLLRLFANLVAPAVRNAQLFVQRDHAMREAERANQVKTRFLASVTHELRTPLNLVINNMDFMRIGVFGDVTDEQIARLDQTIRSAQHLLYLINDLLDVSKIEAGELELYIQENDLYTLLEDAIANTEVVLEQHGKQGKVQLIPEIDEDIPPFPMDARRMRQILVNLLSNAVKFTEEGHVKLRVINRRHYVRIEVEDSGMGIAQNEVNKLFEAFERTTSAKEKAIEGTGLGLPICKFLVEAHGGQIDVTSEVGVGSTFWFTVPTRQKRDTASETQQMPSLLNRVRSDNGDA